MPDRAEGLVPYDLLGRVPLTDEEIAKLPPYDGPTSVPPGHVVVDDDYETGEWSITKLDGRIIPADLWKAYVKAKTAVDALSEQIDAMPYIPKWARDGLPRPAPLHWPILIPHPTPFRNRLPRRPEVPSPMQTAENQGETDET